MKRRDWTSVVSRIKKAALFAGVGLCVAGLLPAVAQAEQVGEIAGHPIFDNHFEDMEITDGGNNSTVSRLGASYAKVYDPRTNGKVASRVEDQGETDTCWAFSVIAAIESNLIKKGYEDSSVNLSEHHLAYFYYNRQNDPLGNTAGDKNCTGYRYDDNGMITSPEWYGNGGTIYGTAIALTTWSGVVKETASEDDASGAYAPQANAPKALAASDCYKSDYRVKNTCSFSYDVNTVKQAVLDYGAVATGMYMGYEYINLSTGASYYNGTTGNHAVTIVGWDDTYSRTNFNSNCRPTKDGAWIVKNSWGTGVGDGGYIYISYEDKSLSQLTAFDVEKTSQTYKNNYQYDGTGNPAYTLPITSGTSVASIYKVKGSSQGYNELLKAVGVNVWTTNVKYSVQIYTGVTSSSNPTKGKAMFSSPQTGWLTRAGYNMITLKTPVTLTAGEKYSVVMKLETANGSDISVLYEKAYDFGWINYQTDVSGGQSFVNNMYGEWADCVEGSGCVRMKAYTDVTTEKTTYKLSDTSLSISKGSSAKLSLNITPSSVKRKVTWTSSNKKVATVSSSGTVKAKAYGTATIKAKFVAGSQTKTLSCKVTVGPSKIKSFKVTGGKKKLTVTWKKNSAATGYAIYYSKKKSSGYKALTTIKTNSKTKYVKSKMKKGTYYVKMRPYITQNGKKLYGSYTAAKQVKVK